MVMEKYRNILSQVQRRLALQIISAYWTTSTEATEVIAGFAPRSDLQVKERAAAYGAAPERREPRSGNVAE